MGMGSSSTPSSPPSSPPSSSAPSTGSPMDILGPLLSGAMAGSSSNGGQSPLGMLSEFITPVIRTLSGGVPFIKNLLGGFGK
jgi:predicted lipid-binding transport protein (Tim44 family)